MNGFELGDVASSSSSSSSSLPPSSSDREDGSSDDGSIDESLARDVRAALHLAVGRICRAEDASGSEGATEEEGGGGAGPASFATSDGAIAALTDLTFHYASTLLANDLAAFARHAKRQTVKTDDVLLAARKDRRGALAELRRAVREDPDRFAEGGKKPRSRSRSRPRPTARPGGGGATSTASARKRPPSRGGGGNNGRRRGGSVKGRFLSKSKGAARRLRKQSVLSSSSSSSSSSSDIDSEGGPFAVRRKKLQLKRKNLDKGSFGKANNAKEKRDGDASENSSSSSSSDDELQFDTRKGMGGSARNKTPTRDKNDSTGKPMDVGKNSDSLFRIDGGGSGEGNDAVIDLSSD